MAAHCPDCGKNLALVGKVHRCVPRVVSQPDMANVGVSNCHMANASPTYKYRDPDKRRAYQRDLMRKKRAASNVSA